MCEKLLKIKQHLKENHITQTDMANKLGVSVAAVNALLTGKRDFGRKTATEWSKAFGFNPVWLLTGDGLMLLSNTNEAGSVLNVPIIDLDAKGGFVHNEVTDIQEYAVGTMAFNNDIARQGDFVMQVSGDSMSPKFPAGCYVLLREVEMWREYLELGLCYVLLLKDGRRIIKDVRAGNDREHFLLCSVNPQFDAVEIARDFIVRVFMVVVLIRKEIN